MSDPRDRNDETLGDDPHGTAQPPDHTFDDGGTVDDPDTWNPASENAATIGSDDLPPDSLERMKKVWGAAIDPHVRSGMTIKVDDVADESAEMGTVDSGEFDVPAEDMGDSRATLEDEDRVSDSSDRTLSDDDLPRVVDDAADRTLVVEDDGPAAEGDEGATIADTVPSVSEVGTDRTIPDSLEAEEAAEGDPDRTFVSEDDEDAEGPQATIGDAGEVRPPAGADRTMMLDDEDSDGSDRTIADGAAPPRGAETDRTLVSDDEDADEPQRTIPDAGVVPRGDDAADRTFVIDPDVEPKADGTVVGSDADGSADSGTFTDPKTLNLDRAADRTMVSEGAVGGKSGDPDTWDPQEQARTYDSHGDHPPSDDVGLEVGVTVRPRSFRSSDDLVPTFAADYEIQRELGRGGMGVVFLARQASIDRDVAVKMLKPPKKKKSERKLAQQRTKFLAEAVVTGDLDHPNIVPVYDLGTDNTGAVFYSMKCVRGTPWDDVVGEKSIAENIEIFMKVADAMAFAHNRGVIHRDLKPENVMLGDFGEVLVMDWGLALTTDQFTKAGKATKSGSIGGTPSYMAPEMAQGDIKKVGVHSDVYLMGAILYEIVTGHPPHSGADVMKCLYNAAKNEIVPTDKSGELVEIALKAMSTRAKSRYRSIGEMQDAIRDYQSHSESIALSMRAAEDLIEAESKSPRERDYEDYSKAMYGFQEAYELWNGNERARRGISEARLAYARCAMDRGDLDLASTLLTDNDPAHTETRQAILAATHERDSRQKRLAMLKRVSIAAACLLFVVISGAAVWINNERAEAKRQEGIALEQKGIAEEKTAEAIAANDKLEDQIVETERERKNAEDARDDALEQKGIAEMERANAVAAQTVAEMERMKAVTAREVAVAEEKKAKRAAFVSWANQQFADLARVESDAARKAAVDARVAEAEQRRNAEVQRELARQQELEALFSGYTAELQRDAAEYSSALAELERLAADFAAEQEAEQRRLAVKAKEDEAEQRMIAEMQRQAAIDAQIEEAKQRKAAEEAQKREEYEAYVAQIGLAQAKIEENAFDSARELLIGCKPELRNWEWGRLMHLCSQSSSDLETDGPVDGIALSPDGKLVAAATWTGKVVVWDLATRKVVRTIVDGGLYVNDVAFSPDGKRLAAVGSEDGEYVKLWDLESGERVALDFEGHEDTALSVQFSQDGKTLLTSSYDDTARLWDVASGRQLKVLKGHSWWVWTARFDPADEKRVVTASQDGTVGIWDLTSERPTLVASFAGHEGPVYSAAFSPDGRSVVSGGYDKKVLVWDPELVRPFDFVAIAEGRTPEPTPFTSLIGHGGAVRTVAFSGDGSLVVSGAHDNTVRVWDPRTGDTLQAFRGHDGWIRSAEFTPNGKSVVSGSKDGSVKVWSMADYEELRVLRGRTLTGHDDAILAAQFSRNGNRVVTASRDRTARVYETETGATLAVLVEGHQFLATSAVFYTDGARVATSAADNSTRVWDVRTGTQLLEIDDTGRSAALDVSPDGKYLLTGAPAGEDRSNWSAQLWDATTGELVRSFDGHRNEVVTVRFSPDGSTVFTGDARGTGRLFDTASGKLKHELSVHNRRINAAAFVEDGARLLTASGDNTVVQWDTATGKEIPGRTLRNGSPILAMDVLPDGERVVTSSLDGTIRIWNVEGGEPVGTIGDGKGMVSGLDVSADGRLVVATDSKRNVVRVWRIADGSEVTIGGNAFLDWSDRRTPIWTARFAPENTSVLTVGGADARLFDLRTGEEQMSFSPHGAVAAADFSTNGRYVVTGSWDFSAKIWSVESGQAIARLDGGHDGFVYCARFSPDENSTRVLTTSEDGTAKLWNTTTHEVVQSFVGHTGPVVHGAFSPDGKRVVTGSTDGTARVWDVATGKTLLVLKGHEWGVLSAEFSRDGRWVVTGSEDNTARVWDVADGQPEKAAFVLRGHTAAVTSVAFSPDGTRVLTGSQDDTVKLWDATKGKEILTLDRHTEPVTAVAFSQDGRFALTGSRDGTAIIWLAVDWNAGAAVAEADAARTGEGAE